MKVLKWLLIVLAVVIVALVACLAYLGAFSTLKVTEMKVGPYTLVYEDYVGPYSGAGAVFSRVNASLKQDGIESSKGFGIYLDDPKQVDGNQFRSQLGCVVEAKYLPRIRALKKKYNVMNFKKRQGLATEFPIKSNLSYLIGPMKAYSAITKYAKDRGLKTSLAMEIYDMQTKKILYIMEIAK